MAGKAPAACTCRSEVVKANEKPSGPDNRYIGHESSCPLHWDVKAWPVKVMTGGRDG